MSDPLRSLAVVTAVGAAAVLGGCSGTKASSEPIRSLSVRELNIVDEHGQARLRLGAPLPDPKGAKRALTIYGIQFMNKDGYEVGGLAMLDQIGIEGLCFDTPDGYSPMCVGLIKGQPQVRLADKGGERIVLGVDKGVAHFVMSDGEGKPRVRLEVDKEGVVRIEGLKLEAEPGTPAKPSVP